MPAAFPKHNVMNLMQDHRGALRPTFYAWAVAVLSWTACSAGAPTSTTPTRSDNAATAAPTALPTFNADSAYQYIARQLDFGPRVPGTEAQREAAAWLEAELRRHGAEVTIQEGQVTAYDGRRLPIINLVGSYNPSAERRILLLSHWDSRPVADHDADPAKRQQAVPAANDGASGVGVLLELARLFGEVTPNVGVDILLTDAEDYGAPDDWEGEHREEHWALGTQYWCRQPHVAGYRADFGVLLDMVGGEGATFYREYFSEQYAGSVVSHIWKTADRLGYGQYFDRHSGGAITDDHYFVNLLTGIPTVDIIHTDADSPNGAFYRYWHTTEDTLDKISTATLRAVGETLTHVVYEH